MNIIVTEEAQHDLEDVFFFYEELDPGVGAEFVEEVQGRLRDLKKSAGIHAKHFGKHRMLVGRFPHAIYYDVVGEDVLVKAIADCRMDTRRIKERIQNDKS